MFARVCWSAINKMLPGQCCGVMRECPTEWVTDSFVIGPKADTRCFEGQWLLCGLSRRSLKALNCCFVSEGDLNYGHVIEVFR